MADKFSVLIKYKYLEYIENAKLSDADSWLFMKGLIEYDKTGKEPKFKNQKLTGLFAVLKCDLDGNRKKWNDRVIANRENGKKGGRPRKSQITHNNPAKPNKPTGYSETQWGPENPQKPDSGSGGDLDSGSGNLDSGGGSGSRRKKPPPQIKQILEESETQGFFIDSEYAKKIQCCVSDPNWLAGPHSYLEFAAAAVRKRYPEKDDDELKAIYIAAMKWEDLQRAYPNWRSKQTARALAAARGEAARKAKDSPPRKCQCGCELNPWLACQTCGGQYAFDDGSLQYKYIPPIDENSKMELLKKYNEKIGKNSGE